MSPPNPASSENHLCNQTIKFHHANAPNATYHHLPDSGEGSIQIQIPESEPGGAGLAQIPESGPGSAQARK